jgi:hypothetical protein
MSNKEDYLPDKEEALQRAKEKLLRPSRPRIRRKVKEEYSWPGELGFVEREKKMIEQMLEEQEDGADVREKINLCLANIELARQRMSNDQIEIDRLREETRSLIANINLTWHAFRPMAHS